MKNERSIFSGETVFKKHDSSTVELIKWIALLLMLMDHCVFVYIGSESPLRILTRPSMTLFAFLVVHNYIYFSTEKNKFFVRLLFFAIVAEPFHYALFGFDKLNILFLFFASMTSIYLVERIQGEIKNSSYIFKKLATVFVVLAGGLMSGLYVGYGFLGYGFVLLLYMAFISDVKKWYFICIFVSLFLMGIHSISGLSIIFSLLFYPIVYIVSILVEEHNLTIPRSNKYTFYFFYPTHLFLLVVLVWLWH